MRMQHSCKLGISMWQRPPTVAGDRHDPRTVPPIFWNTSMMPSRSMVARICSDPGEMVNGTLALMPAANA